MNTVVVTVKVVVIDGQGGRLGQLIVEAIIKEKIPCELYAVGTNSIATSATLKAGASLGATGENPVKVVCRDNRTNRYSCCRFAAWRSDTGDGSCYWAEQSDQAAASCQPVQQSGDLCSAAYYGRNG